MKLARKLTTWFSAFCILAGIYYFVLGGYWNKFYFLGIPIFPISSMMIGISIFFFCRKFGDFEGLALVVCTMGAFDWFTAIATGIQPLPNYPRGWDGFFEGQTAMMLGGYLLAGLPILSVFNRWHVLMLTAFLGIFFLPTPIYHVYEGALFLYVFQSGNPSLSLLSLVPPGVRRFFCR